MSFNQNQTVPKEIRDKLPFLKDAYYYIVRNSAKTILRGLLFELSSESYYKAFNRLSGDKGDIIKGDKVFMLPNCKIPLFKIKEYFRTINASLTDDVSKATKIIGHNRCRESVISQAANSSILLMMDAIWYYSNWRPQVTNHSYNKSDEAVIKSKEKIFNKVISRMQIASQEDVITVDTIVSKNACTDSSNPSYEIPDHNDFKVQPGIKRFVTPTGVLILYHHIANKIPVINEDYIAEAIDQPVTIGKDEYDSICKLFESKDHENIKVGTFLVANCNPVKSFFWLQKLAKKYKSKINNFTEYKNVRLFEQVSDWNTIGSYTPEECIEHMYQQGTLLQEYFDHYIYEAQQLYKGKFQSQVFRIVLEPNSRYAEFANETHKFNYTKEPEDSEVEIVENEPEEIEED